MTILTDYKKHKALMKDFHHVVALAVRKRRVLAQRIFYSIFGFLGIAAGILVLAIGGNMAIGLVGIAAGIFFAVRALFYYAYLGFMSGRLMAKQIDTVRYTFDKENVIIDDALEHCEHPYHVFHGIYEARRVFVLLVTTRIGYVIAKSDLSEGETEQLRALFKEKFEQPLVYFDV